ncbi:hypothetical protein JQ604_27200 [Bradyrhizobium jicamae]|uniref:hypothetical protein n=1 Tax=Bradyrhizobium jicamae TaxID=280332 RepID=UPI001BAAB16E|nr:hypothetical protein [Bradyrhizobium jicamae]MBR0755875.1 hypothetical protein [Bradyrhizobium jicamae]
MSRRFAITAVLASSFVAAGWAQSPPTQPAPAASAPIKSAAKKAAPKAKPAAKQPAAVETGPCRLGVISVLGDQFAVQKFGVTVFEYEGTEVPINWGFDDLVFARVRAATGNDPGVRKISFARGAFDPFYHPQSRFLPDPREGIPAIVQSITTSSNCERYLVVTKFKSRPQNSNLELNGIGTYNQGLGSVLRHSHLFANISLTLLDGRSYERVNRAFANFGSNLAEGMRLTENPLNKLDNADFPTPPEAASSSALLRERTRTLIAAELDRRLPGYLKDE